MTCVECSGGNGHLAWCRIRGGTGRVVAPQRTKYWVTVNEAAEKLRVKRNVIEAMIRERRLTVIKRGHIRLISSESLSKQV